MGVATVAVAVMASSVGGLGKRDSEHSQSTRSPKARMDLFGAGCSRNSRPVVRQLHQVGPVPSAAGPTDRGVQTVSRPERLALSPASRPCWRTLLAEGGPVLLPAAHDA